MRERNKTDIETIEAGPAELSEETADSISGGPHFRTWNPPTNNIPNRFLDHDFGLNE